MNLNVVNGLWEWLRVIIIQGNMYDFSYIYKTEFVKMGKWNLLPADSEYAKSLDAGIAEARAQMAAPTRK